MKKPTIPEEIKQEMNKIIDEFNKKTFSDRTDRVFYFAEYKGKFLYLNRKEYRNISPVARLTYSGNKNKWDFAIFKWTIERYDPEEDYFPGVKYVDGTIEGAMKAGMEAYPI